MRPKENKDTWDLIQFYVDCHNVDANHIRAYDEFIERAKKMLETEIVVGNITLYIKNLQTVAPYHIVEGKKIDIFPSECVKFKETYCSDIFCDIECVVTNDEIEEYMATDIQMISELIKYIIPKAKKIKEMKQSILERFLKGKDKISWKSLTDADYKSVLRHVKPHVNIEDFMCNDEECECKTNKDHHILERIILRIKDVSKTRKRTYSLANEDRKIFERVHIGTIPVMVGSCLCNLRTGNPSEEILKDEFKFGLGGYFIYKGTSRFIMFQERSTFNRFMLFDDEKAKSKNKKFLQSIEIRNSATDDAPTSSVALGLQKDGYFYVYMKYLNDKKYIPAVLFFHAMGYKNPKDIIDLIVNKDDPFFKDASPYILKFLEQGDGEDYVDHLGNLGKDKVNDKELYAQTIIEKFFLHHYRDIKEKAHYFGFMILSLLKFIKGEIRAEDRDHFGKKVLDTEAALFSNVFYTSMRRTISEITSNLEKCTGQANINANILFPFKDPTKMPITSGFSKALTMNMWGGTEKKDGVSQVFSPYNYAGAIISLQRCTLQLKKMNKKKKPRMVHGSMYGVIDPFDTPEGENVGFNKVQAALAFVSNSLNIDNIREYLKKHIHPIGEKSHELKKVFIDNYWIGNTTTEKAIKLERKLRNCKRNGSLNLSTVSIVWNDIREELHIYAQCGRLMRPWLVVEDGKLLYDSKYLKEWKTWDDAIYSGVIEMLDQNELEFTMIATSISDFYKLTEEERKECRYCDIHPATLLGAGAGCITDPSRNQGPRNAYGANMKRQAVGTTGRFDSGRTLFYPQRALVENKLANVLLKYDQLPAGVNVPIAFTHYKGMTIEDGSVVKKSAIEMGWGWTSKTTSHLMEITDPENETIEIPNPNECYRYKSRQNYHLDENGIVKVGSCVEENDVLCGKTIMLDNGTRPKMDQSLLYKETNRGYVKKVDIIEKGWRGCKIIKIDIVEIRIPEWGNKITPLCAQKTTIAEIANEEDMPFSPNPCEASPVVIYSPQCFPSRMTISLLYEVFLGRYVSSIDYARVRKGKKGKYHHNGSEDCTPFEGNDDEKLEWIMDQLVRMGYRRDGCSELINGMNGRPMKVHSFTGIVHMQILKHMVADKINARASGPVQSVMRCPTEGRSKNGGTKIGTMEKDCLIANGATHTILDRMCLSSSKFTTTVCSRCGIVESYNSTKNDRCRVCRKDGVMVPITIPYSFKVVSQHLMALNMCMRVLTK